MGGKYKNYLTYAIFMALALAPSIALGFSYAQDGYAAITAEFLNPDKLFKELKKNVTIPIFQEGSEIKVSTTSLKVPTTSDVLKEASPKLKEINTDVREETGIDLSKFLSWFVKILKIFFQLVVDILEKVSQALKS